MTPVLRANRLEIDKDAFKPSPQQIEERWALEQEQALMPSLDKALASIFSALTSRKLVAIGFVDTSRGQVSETRGTWLEIPPDHWTLSGFDREDGCLSAGSRHFRAAQMSVSQLLYVFPAPASTPTRRAVSAYPGVMIEDEATSIDSSPENARRQGRSLTGDGTALVVTTHVFGSEIQKLGSPGAIKQEALAHEVVSFFEKHTEHRISKNTAISYFKLIKELIANFPPKNPSNN